MVTISVTIPNLEAWTARLEKIGVELTDFTDAMRVLGAHLVDYFSTTPFETLGRNYSGGQWPDVTAARMAYKAKHWPQNTHRTLQASGTMKDSFYGKAERTNLQLLNKQPYFDAHQYGGGNMPRRVMVAVNAAVKEMVVRDIEQSIQEKINMVK